MAHRIGSLRSATDEQLVVAATVGSLLAFDELVRRFRPGLTRMVAGLCPGSPSVDDVVQDTFVLAFRHLPSLSRPAAFPGWLCAIARNRARRTAKEGQRTQTTPPDTLDRLVLERLGSVESPSEAGARRQRARELFRSMEHLPRELRATLSLRALDGWSVARIAAFLNVTEATVRGRLYRARAIVRRETGIAREEEEDE